MSNTLLFPSVPWGGVDLKAKRQGIGNTIEFFLLLRTPRLTILDAIQLVQISTNDSRREVAAAEVGSSQVTREELRLLKEILAQKVPGEAPGHVSC